MVWVMLGMHECAEIYHVHSERMANVPVALSVQLYEAILADAHDARSKVRVIALISLPRLTVYFEQLPKSSQYKQVLMVTKQTKLKATHAPGKAKVCVGGAI